MLDGFPLRSCRTACFGQFIAVDIATEGPLNIGDMRHEFAKRPAPFKRSERVRRLGHLARRLNNVCLDSLENLASLGRQIGWLVTELQPNTESVTGH